MNRREFLKGLAVLGTSVTLGNSSAYSNWLTNEKRNGFPQGMLLIDAHAHPDQLYYMGGDDQWEDWCAQYCDESSTLEKIMKLAMNGSSFAAIGDTELRAFTMDEVVAQIQKVITLEQRGLVRILRRHDDMPHGNPSKTFVPGALLSLEGASPLGDDQETALANLELLFGYGVRMITLMHYLDNQFGYAMRRGQVNSDDVGLSDLGEKVIERMMELGILVDVAHAHYATLKDIKEIAVANGCPIVDSHTSLSPCKDLCGGRLRTWTEMKMIASTGGTICTWPLKWEREDGSGRLTLHDWAQENRKMKERLGSEHIALGTDGGGRLPDMVDGYESILDLPKLVKAMDHAGFKRNEIEAYMGRNLFRVISKCIG